MSEFTHFNSQGEAIMVDVTDKQDTEREAIATGKIQMSDECYEKVKYGNMKKGDVLGVARIAGIMGAKKTSDLIPLCHILNLTKVEIDFRFHDEYNLIEAICTAKVSGKTGVEMEALTGVNIALLTIYDMCKAVDKGMEIGEIKLLRKSGGKSGLWERKPQKAVSEKEAKEKAFELDLWDGEKKSKKVPAKKEDEWGLSLM